MESTGIMAEPGIKAGNELVQEILKMGVSKYRLGKDIGVCDTQVYKWVRNEQSPNLENFNKLQAYWQYHDRLKRIPKPFGR